jgi:hypothetical protein
MTFEQVMTTLFSHPVFKAVLTLIVLNILVGLLASAKNGVFHVDQITDFLRTMVIPYVGGGLLFQLMLWGVSSDFMPSALAQISGTVIWTAIVVALLWRFLRHLKALWPELPLTIEPAVNQDTSSTSILTQQPGRGRTP